MKYHDELQAQIEAQREHRLQNIRRTVDRIQARLNFCPSDIHSGKVTREKMEYVFAGEVKRLDRELKALYKVLPNEV